MEIFVVKGNFERAKRLKRGRSFKLTFHGGDQFQFGR